MNRKLLILGIDGMDLDLYKQFCSLSEKYKMIMKEFSHGKMKSDIPPITIPAWLSIFTGKNPGNLGLVDFFQIERDYQRNPINMSIFEKSFFWNLMDKKTILVELPILLEHLSIDTNLEELITKSVIRNSKALSIAKENFEIRKRNLNKVCNEDYNILFAFFGITDRGIHCGKEKDMKKIYENLNDFLFEVKSKCDKENWNLMIVSDHGGKKVDKSFNINTWFSENGYLKFKNKLSLTLKIGCFIYEKNSSLARTLLHLHYEFKKLFGVDPGLGRVVNLEKFVWKDTKCFAISTAITSFMPVWINIKQKFDEGVVEEKEYENLRKELKEKLLEVEVVDKVWYKEEIYNGEHMDKMPDLIVKAKNNCLVEHRHTSKIISNVNRYVHSLYGTFLVYGSEFVNNEIVKAEIIDITPTVLHLMGCEIPKDIDGKVLEVKK